MDAAIGELVTKLKAQGLYDSTLIVITAKHGQSPIDPNRYVSQLINGSSPVTLLSNAGYIPNSESNNPSGIGPTEDDVSLIWLKNSADNDASVKLLEENAYETGIGLGQIYYGPSLTLNYNDPMVDPRTPDIIVAPNVGVTYSGSKKKLEEHGGFSHDDTNVMLLVAFPGIEPRTMKTAVSTAQVAPIILKWMGLDSAALLAVRKEETSALPVRTAKLRFTIVSPDADASTG